MKANFNVFYFDQKQWYIQGSLENKTFQYVACSEPMSIWIIYSVVNFLSKKKQKLRFYLWSTLSINLREIVIAACVQNSSHVQLKMSNVCPIHFVRVMPLNRTLNFSLIWNNKSESFELETLQLAAS